MSLSSCAPDDYSNIAVGLLSDDEPPKPLWLYRWSSKCTGLSASLPRSLSGANKIYKGKFTLNWPLLGIIGALILILLSLAFQARPW